MVIDEARETERPYREYSERELKEARFRRTFCRSPTPSEEELEEADWVEIEDYESGRDDEKPDEEAAPEAAPEAAAKAAAEAAAKAKYEAIVQTGLRIRMCFGVPAKWVGGLVGEQHDDGSFEIGLDDGDLRLMVSTLAL
jgi:hypothetical protein